MMPEISLQMPFYKALVDMGFISSNAEAKRLVHQGAIRITPTISKRGLAYKVTLTDTVADIGPAIAHQFWLSIGKTFHEQMSIVERGK